MLCMSPSCRDNRLRWTRSVTACEDFRDERRHSRYFQVDDRTIRLVDRTTNRFVLISFRKWRIACKQSFVWGLPSMKLRHSDSSARCRRTSTVAKLIFNYAGDLPFFLIWSSLLFGRHIALNRKNDESIIFSYLKESSGKFLMLPSEWKQRPSKRVTILVQTLSVDSPPSAALSNWVSAWRIGNWFPIDKDTI